MEEKKRITQPQQEETKGKKDGQKVTNGQRKPYRKWMILLSPRAFISGSRKLHSCFLRCTVLYCQPLQSL